jgi:hypothetical protein
MSASCVVRPLASVVCIACRYRGWSPPKLPEGADEAAVQSGGESRRPAASCVFLLPLDEFARAQGIRFAPSPSRVTDSIFYRFMGHSGLYNRVIGSTTDRLVELAPCTILVVK